MRFEGELIAWNAGTGYGVIRPRGGGDDVAVGMAAFPMDGNTPHLGEILSFELVTARDGGKRAAKVQRVELRPDDSQFAALRDGGAAARRSRGSATARRRRLGLTLAALVLGLAALGGAYFGWAHAAGPEVSASARP